ncbi:MAG: NAD(P)/FAD-dependent oxidoreductase [Campylobacterales bacterium]
MLDIVVIGGGASALFFGTFIKNREYVILEASEKLAQKLAISGGGKCNITNAFLSEKNYLGDREFIANSFKHYNKNSLLLFLKNSALEVFRDDRVVPGQYFFKTSSKLIEVLKKSQSGKLINNTKVIDIEYTDHFIIKTSSKSFNAKHIVIASGGISYEALGVSSIGYDIAKKFNHKIVTPKPALVGFTVQKEQFWFKNLSGISIFCKLTYKDKIFKGMILFTHKGFSGPVALNASLYFEKGSLEIDFLPKTSTINILRNSKKQISTLLPLPKRFIKEFLNSIGLDDKKAIELSPQEIEKLNTIHNYKLSPAGNFGFSKAEITKGGVSTENIDSETMESKLQKNLYFIGEVLDVSGELGGYNLQWCATSAYIAAHSLMATED